MAAGNGASRSDRTERRIIRSLHFVTFPAAIHKTRFGEALLVLRFVNPPEFLRMPGTEQGFGNIDRDIEVLI